MPNPPDRPFSNQLDVPTARIPLAVLYYILAANLDIGVIWHRTCYMMHRVVKNRRIAS